MFLITITLCLSLNAITSGTVKNTDDILGHYEDRVRNLERPLRSTDTIDSKSSYLDENEGGPDTDFESDDDKTAQDGNKRPFVFRTGGFGKRPFDDSRNKRPFVIGGGYTFGKRSQSDLETRPDIYDDYGDIVKRPFVLGSGFKFGKRDIAKYFLNSYIPKYDDQDQVYIAKRPFVLSGGYNFGKRNRNEGYDLEKRPFVLGGGFRYGKRSGHNHVDKRPFVLGSGSGYGKRFSHDYSMAKRPFVLGSYGKRASDDQNSMVNKRPFVLGGYGKRENSEVIKRPFVLGSYGKRDKTDNDNPEKRPFVLGNYGKREKSSENTKTDDPFVLDDFQSEHDEDHHSDDDSERKHLLDGILRDIYMAHSDVDKRPFVLGGYGKRENQKYRTVDKRPFVLGGYGKRDGEAGKRPFVLGKFGKRDVVSKGHVKKRPFSHGWSFGKRSLSEPSNADLESVLQNLEYVYSKTHRGDEGRRNTLSKNTRKNSENNDYVAETYGTDTFRTDLQKRPFILGGPYTFGKVYEFGKRGNTREYANGIFKRPFVLSSPNRFSTQYQFGKRSGPDTLMNGRDRDDDEEIHTQKRPFVLGGGGFLFKKRPNTPVSQYQIGKRDTPIFNNDELSDYVNDFTMDKRARDMDFEKRPFVFGGGPNFGKRSNGFEQLINRNFDYSDDDTDRRSEMVKHHFGRTQGVEFRSKIPGLEFDRPQQYIR